MTNELVSPACDDSTRNTHWVAFKSVIGGKEIPAGNPEKGGGSIEVVESPDFEGEFVGSVM